MRLLLYEVFNLKPQNNECLLYIQYTIIQHATNDTTKILTFKGKKNVHH